MSHRDSLARCSCRSVRRVGLQGCARPGSRPPGCGAVVPPCSRRQAVVQVAHKAAAGRWCGLPDASVERYDAGARGSDGVEGHHCWCRMREVGATLRCALRMQRIGEG